MDFEVVNGFTGMHRDIVLRLCNLIWTDLEKTRKIFGMCGEVFWWKQHPFFLENRPSDVPYSFRLNPTGGCEIAPNLSCVFTVAEDKTVFLENSISQKIYKWTIRISYAKNEFSAISLGAVSLTSFPPSYMVGTPPSSILNAFNNSFIGAIYGSGSLRFYRRTESDGVVNLASGVYGVHNHASSLDLVGVTTVPDGAVVGLEADCAAQTLSFFVDEIKTPRVISLVTPPLFLGVSGEGKGTSLTSLSFRRMPHPTQSTVACEYYELEKLSGRGADGEEDGEGGGGGGGGGGGDDDDWDFDV